MEKLDKEMDAQEFLGMIMENYPNLAICLNCPHHNGDCANFVRQRKCRVYDYDQKGKYVTKRVLNKK